MVISVIEAASPRHSAASTAAPAPALRAAVLTTTGVPITSAHVAIESRQGGWRATLRRLDRPGQLASAYFVGRLRDVVLAFDDGRTARARIAGSRFVGGAERVFEVEGTEPIL
ncbi:MAG TPA: hypothetical protein VNM91_04015 [Dehalococcoidia bacterium]|nr:hypothetical protein [Dehalococcoidia bacterium]